VRTNRQNAPAPTRYRDDDTPQQQALIEWPLQHDDTLQKMSLKFGVTVGRVYAARVYPV
jgi:hypothetical protein